MLRDGRNKERRNAPLGGLMPQFCIYRTYHICPRESLPLFSLFLHLSSLPFPFPLHIFLSLSIPLGTEFTHSKWQYCATYYFPRLPSFSSSTFMSIFFSQITDFERVRLFQFLSTIPPKSLPLYHIPKSWRQGFLQGLEWQETISPGVGVPHDSSMEPRVFWKSLPEQKQPLRSIFKAKLWEQRGLSSRHSSRTSSYFVQWESRREDETGNRLEGKTAYINSLARS